MNKSVNNSLIIAISVTKKQLEIIEQRGRSLSNKILALDNVNEVCYDDWYGPYICCIVHEDNEKTMIEVSKIVEEFLKKEGCIQQQITFDY